MDLKHVVVVDDDIDVYNPMDVEWAIATRVQADRDVFIIPGARAKPLDPSLPVMPPGVVPTGAKVGIDATIPEGIPQRALRAHRLRLCGPREDRRLREGQDGRCSRKVGRRARGRGAGGRDPEGHRGQARLLHRDRRDASPSTISRPSRARSAICTRRKSCGRTRRAACASAARNSPPNRRGNSRPPRRPSRPRARHAEVRAKRASKHARGTLRMTARRVDPSSPGCPLLRAMTAVNLVVLLSDGETVHNAFPDEGFMP